MAETLGGLPEGRDELKTAEDEMKNVRSEVEKLYAFLAEHRSAPDAARLEKGRQEGAQGKVKSPDDLRSRFAAA